jgi:hypothetical protein
LKKKFSDLLGHDYVFSIIRYQKVHIDLNEKNLVSSKALYLTRRHKSHQAGFKNGIADFIDFYQYENNQTPSPPPTIIVPDKVQALAVDYKELNRLMHLCVNNVLIQIHNRLFIRLNGIPHSSVCSRMLCDIYLGRSLVTTCLHLDNRIAPEFVFLQGRFEMDLFNCDDETTISNSMPLSRLPFDQRMKLDKANELILRIVDDYLIICDNEKRMDAIKQRLGRF